MRRIKHKLENRLQDVAALVVVLVFACTPSTVADERAPTALAETRSIAATPVIGASITRATWRQRVVEIPPRPNHEWRKTRLGWQQVPIRPEPEEHLIEIPPGKPLVHPIQAASLILLLTLAAMTWASDEWDWKRFIEDED